MTKEEALKVNTFLNVVMDYCGFTVDDLRSMIIEQRDSVEKMLQDLKNKKDGVSSIYG